jgi:hypothetical protein
MHAHASKDHCACNLAAEERVQGTLSMQEAHRLPRVKLNLTMHPNQPQHLMASATAMLPKQQPLAWYFLVAHSSMLPIMQSWGPQGAAQF